MHPEGRAARVTWPYVEDKSYLWTWLFFVPLAAYTLWQLMYFFIVNVLRRQRLLKDPEVMTSYRYMFAFFGLAYTIPISLLCLMCICIFPCPLALYWEK
jgi:predicted ATPase